MNFGKASTLFIVILFMTSSFASIATLYTLPSVQAQITLPTDWPSVYVHPETVNASIGDTFSISVVVFNLTDNTAPDPENPLVPLSLGNLYGFDIQFSWDPTILSLMDYTVTVPFEDYSSPVPPSPYAGILHLPIFQLANITDEGGSIPGAESPEVRAWFGWSSWPPAGVCNGNATFFTMTFNVTSDGACDLDLVSVALSDDDGQRLLFHQFDGAFSTPGSPVADFTFWPEVGVVDKPVIFDASASYDPDGSIVSYMWDFGDGNTTTISTPIIQHSYNDSRDYAVSLTVEDSDGLTRSKMEMLSVVGYRNTKLNRITLPSPRAKVNQTISIEAQVENDGKANENITMKAYYNTSLIDWNDISTASWQEFDEKNVSLSYIGAERVKSVDLSWNTTGIALINASYYVLVNTTLVPYEGNVKDNNMTSSIAVFITNVDMHDVAIETLEFGWNALGTNIYNNPVIGGEISSVFVEVWNKGTGTETLVDVKLYSNGSLLESWIESMAYGENVELRFSRLLNASAYNLTVQAMVNNDAYLDDNSQQGILQVISAPRLNFTFTPKHPSVNQSVFIDASSSIHRQVAASITEYTWEIWIAGETSWEDRFTGPNLINITYEFIEAREWRVILNVRDSYDLEYDRFRGATSAYRLQGTIEIQPPPEAIPIEYILVAIVVIIVAVVAAVVLYLRRRASP